MSGYLQPQSPVENVKDAILNNPVVKAMEEEIKSKDEGAIELENLRARLQQESEVNRDFTVSDMTGYTWSQEENVIQITGTCNSDQVEITEHEDVACISSCLLKGPLFGKVEKHEVSHEDGHLTIKLFVEGHWPVVVIGDDIDACSTAYLAVAADNVTLPEMATRLYRRGAINGCLFAVNHMATCCEESESLYWYGMLAANEDNKDARIKTAKQLFEKGGADNLKLAEVLAVDLAKKRIVAAYRILADIHLKQTDGFANCESLATQYLRNAVDDFDDADAKNMLATCYEKGVGVEQDLREAARLRGEPLPEPVVEEPAVEDPEPVAEEPVVEDPEPVAEEPAVEEPEPVAEEPAVEDPEPVAEEPAVEDPEPIAEKPAVEEPEPVAAEPEVRAAEPEAPATKPAPCEKSVSPVVVAVGITAGLALAFIVTKVLTGRRKN